MQQTKQAQQLRRALPSIIGFAGLKRSGKDTLADFMVTGHGFTKVAFADAIRSEVHARYNIAPVGDATKDAPLESQNGRSYRDLLVAHGMARRAQRATYWIDQLAAKVHGLLDQGDRVVISDVRMSDEIAWIRANGGVVVWVDREGVVSDGSPTEQDHYEECDYGVLNSGVPGVMALKLVAMIMENPSYQDTKSTGRPPRLAMASLRAILSTEPNTPTGEARVSSQDASEDVAQVGLRYYAVTGRIPGDDEDATMLFQADDREHAIEQFKDAMWSGQGDEDDRASMEGEHGTDTYINSVLVSDTPIEEA